MEHGNYFGPVAGLEKPVESSLILVWFDLISGERKGPTQDEDLSLQSIDLRVCDSEIHMFSFFVSAAQLHLSTYIRVEAKCRRMHAREEEYFLNL